MTDLVLLNVQDGIATLTLNRPDKRNAMSDEMRTQFVNALESVAADKAIRALVLTGAGKGFCAGGDIAGHGATHEGAGRRNCLQRMAPAATRSSHAGAAAHDA